MREIISHVGPPPWTSKFCENRFSEKKVWAPEGATVRKFVYYIVYNIYTDNFKNSNFLFEQFLIFRLNLNAHAFTTWRQKRALFGQLI